MTAEFFAERAETIGRVDELIPSSPRLDFLLRRIW